MSLDEVFRVLFSIPTVKADICTDEDFYQDALEFVPERWYSKPDMIKHKNAFAVFSLGTEGCIGKNCKFSKLDRGNEILTEVSGLHRASHPLRPTPAQLRCVVGARRGWHAAALQDQRPLYIGPRPAGSHIHVCVVMSRNQARCVEKA